MRLFCTYRQVFPGFGPISGGMYTECALEGGSAAHTGYVHGRERGLGREGNGEPDGAVVGDTAGVARAGIGAERLGAAVGSIGNLEERNVEDGHVCREESRGNVEHIN